MSAKTNERECIHAHNKKVAIATKQFTRKSDKYRGNFTRYALDELEEGGEWND